MNNNTFEESLKEIESIVLKLEEGDISLQESINLYKKGMTILKECSNKIEKVEKRTSNYYRKGVIMVFEQELFNKQNYINNSLKSYFPKNKSDYNEIVIKAMEYSLFAGGKRLRPLFMYEAFSICKGKDISIECFMTAIEMIHTYSLIHDDLPALDNDDLRRGNPTCHIKFGENIAILAGDGLLNYAFEVMINASMNNCNINVLKAMNEISSASGINGMIGGQVADVLNENKQIDIDCLNYIHINKTSKIIEASFTAGAYLANSNDVIIQNFRKIGRNIGLAFQIQDDILDILGDEKELGKPINSDNKNNKSTYTSLMGIDESKKLVDKLYDESILLINSISEDDCCFLVNLLRHLKSRRK